VYDTVSQKSNFFSLNVESGLVLLENVLWLVPAF
jgi:hypothetical protein